MDRCDLQTFPGMALGEFNVDFDWFPISSWYKTCVRSCETDRNFLTVRPINCRPVPNT